MIQKLSLLNVADNCGVSTIRCIHNYGGFYKKVSKTGEFLKASVRSRKYHSRWVGNKVFFPMKKGRKLKAYIVRTKFKTVKMDGTEFFFTENSALTLKKRLTSYGRYTYGPFSYHHKRKKVLASFAGLI